MPVVDVVLKWQDAADVSFRGKTAIVIDVLRATSTIVTALSNGCRAVCTTCKTDEALELRKIFNEQECILGGERECVKIQGFDLGNSPLEYMHGNVKGKVVIMSTTNGTQAINAAKDAELLLVGSLLNRRCAAQTAQNAARDITIVCAGLEGDVSLEDSLCAGAIVSCIEGYEMTQNAKECRSLYEENADSVQALLEKSLHLQRLRNKGFAGDIEYCTQNVDMIDIAPYYDNNRGVIVRGETCLSTSY